MKARLTIAAAVLTVAAVLGAWAASTVEQSVVTGVALSRGVVPSISGQFQAGGSVCFTNWTCYADGTTNNSQGLTNVVAQLVYATDATNITANATATNAATGVVSFSFTIPAAAVRIRCQVKLTDGGGAGNVYRYPVFPLTLMEQL